MEDCSKLGCIHSSWTIDLERLLIPSKSELSSSSSSMLESPSENSLRDRGIGIGEMVNK